MAEELDVQVEEAKLSMKERAVRSHGAPETIRLDVMGTLPDNIQDVRFKY